MTINFECKNCIHFPVCAIRSEAAEILKSYDNVKISESESFKVSLNCRYYEYKSVIK